MLSTGSFFSFAFTWILLPQVVVKADFVSPSDSCGFDTRGSSPVGVREFVLSEDSSRPGSSPNESRPVPFTVWYPAIDDGESPFVYNQLVQGVGTLAGAEVASPSSESYPLLVLSHGSFSTRVALASLCEHLASWGFVVAAPSHAGNTADAGMYDANLNAPYSFDDRPMDVSFVINSLLNDPDFQVSSTNIGVLGDSVGGSTAAVAPVNDSRIRAAMSISPTLGVLNNDSTILSGLNVPFLVVGGQKDTVVPIDPNNPFFYDNALKAIPRWNLIVKDAGHTSFADTCSFFDVVLQFACMGDTQCAYAIFGGGDASAGEFQVTEAICDVVTTLPLLRYSAVSFFRSSLSNKKDAKKATECLSLLNNAGNNDSKYLAEYKLTTKSRKAGKAGKASKGKKSKSP